MTNDEIRQEIAKFRFWYHKINLGHGIITPGLDLDPIWEMVRKVRGTVDYGAKKVLDIASFDGMWAFEAEKLGAELVVATDCYYSTLRNFLFCRDVLRSNVVPYYNISPYDLWNRLDVFLQENWQDEKPFDRLFDIVQHLGLLYHLRDPLLTLSQARSVIKTGGYLLIETGAVINEKRSFMAFNGVTPQSPNGGRIYNDATTWWAPTVPCLKEMLQATLFEPIEETVHILDDGIMKLLRSGLKSLMAPSQPLPFSISRVCMVAKAISPQDVDREFYRELSRTYRNPGLATQTLFL
jgi:tRNA (mo5U34)-methyltransferase